MLTNAAIAERLEAFSVLLELAGAQSYTSRAYRRAADMIRETPVPIVELVREGRVRDLRGIGPGIEQRLRELVETGEIYELSELEREVLRSRGSAPRRRPSSPRHWRVRHPPPGTARRGWATAADVLNTRPLDELLAWKDG